MTAPKKIIELVARFKDNISTYKNSSYNEAQTRCEFIDPLFSELGWDITNTLGYAEAYKDVIHEDSIIISGKSKSPDYSFRIGGQRKFFVEAKKPHISIKDSEKSSFQLRRYAWSANLPISIVTNFCEFSVYDCRTKPSQADDAKRSRIKYYTCDDYISKWDELVSLFSKDAILKGAFDKYALFDKTKKGTSEVDSEFLIEIEQWRKLLAHNIVLRNKLSIHEINDAVQKTIDRIIFLRIAEDRGIEKYGSLREIGKGKNVFAALREYFHNADIRYNSGLFHFRHEKGESEQPDKITATLNIDDKPLKDILKRLYYPESPYEFSVLPADILGHVYEQFLGKIIRLTGEHRAIIEDKPEVRKAGGVFYTPTYIVEYIIRNTLGKILDKKNPTQAKSIRILDPACGSGSFLLVAYQYLLDWHLKWYMENNPDKWSKKNNKSTIYYNSKGTLRLTTTERKRILLANIYGVDIDSQAVEVTKLSLLLKVLEGESGELINQQLKLYHDRALPDLGNNIKCGNSLIGNSLYEIGAMRTLTDEQHLSINAFDWHAEFPEILNSGGFDIVIGNPPYLSIDDTWGAHDVRLLAIKHTYPHIHNDKTDILYYFLAKSTTIAKEYVSFIVSRSFLEAYKADKLRTWLSNNASVHELVDFQELSIFKGIGITTAIVTLRPKIKEKATTVYKCKTTKLPSSDLESIIQDPSYFEKISRPQRTLSSSAWHFEPNDVSELNKKIDRAGTPLGDILTIGQGMQTGRNNAFGRIDIKTIKQWGIDSELYFKRARNTHIQSYNIIDKNEYMLYLENIEKFSDLPMVVQEHLQIHRTELTNRAAYKRGNCAWWKYTWPLHKEHYSKNKIFCPYLASRNKFAIDTNSEYIGLTDTTVLFENGQPEDLLYILGLLNSTLLTFRYKSIGKLKSQKIYEFFDNGISKIPIKRINFKDKNDTNMHKHIVDAVIEIQKTFYKIQIMNTQHEKQTFQRKISAIDREINKLVYELYGLTQADINKIEASNHCS